MNIYLILIFAQNFPAQTIQSQVREAVLWLWAHAAVAEDPGSVTSTHVTSVPGGPVPCILCPLYSPSSGAQKLIKAPRCAHTDTQTHAHVHTNQTEKKNQNFLILLDTPTQASHFYSAVVCTPSYNFFTLPPGFSGKEIVQALGTKTNILPFAFAFLLLEFSLNSLAL